MDRLDIVIEQVTKLAELCNRMQDVITKQTSIITEINEILELQERKIDELINDQNQ